MSRHARSLALLTTCMLVVGAVRTLPLSLAGVTEEAVAQTRAEIAADLGATAEAPAVDRWIEEHQSEYASRVAAAKVSLKDELRFEGEDGRRHAYLGDYDSYLWIQRARTYLRRGTVCDEVVNGDCRETMVHPPVGREMLYGTSLHTATIVALHKLITLISPGFPISTTAFFVPVLVGVLGVIPSFILGRRFGGTAGALTAALVAGLNPALLIRSIGSDNDIWNVVLPLYAVWAAVAALDASSRRLQILYSIAGAIVVAAHAATWNGWIFSHALVAIGVGATLALSICRSAWSRRSSRPWSDPDVRRIAVVLATYMCAAAVAVTAVNPDDDFFTANIKIIAQFESPLTSQAPSAADPDVALWPEEFSSVSELLKLRDNNITSFTTNVPLLFVAFLGAALLAIGGRPWAQRQWLLLGVAALLVAYASFNAPDGIRPAGALVFAPTAIAVLASLPRAGRNDDLERGALLVVVWLVAAFTQGLSANRFVMFFAPPVGLAAGVAIGWLHDLVRDLAAPRAGGRVAQWAAGAVVAALLVVPVYRGYVRARDFLPKMNDAWWDTFTAIGREAPPGTVINLWWHDGHWAKFIADRPVIADGASLRTHINYWFRHALLESDDARAAGLLRMLNCGSDALPYPEGSSGAYGKLRAEGLSVIEAHDLVDRLAGETQSGAEAILTGRGLRPTAIASVLQSTHCEPPPMYLVLGDDLATTAGWGNGRWDFRRAYLAKHAVDLPRDQALRELTDDLGYTPVEARQLHRAAANLETRKQVRNFIAPEIGFLTKTWIPCTPDPRGAFNVCPLAKNVGAGQVLEALEYSNQMPTGARLRIRKPGRDGTPSYSYRTPGTVFVADEQAFRRATIHGATDPSLAVLIDVGGGRLLMAEAVLLGSTFTKLVFLDGRYLHHFEKLSAHESEMDDRVVTYRVRP